MNEGNEDSEFDILFQLARNLTPDEQTEFLERECPDEHRRRELSELLASFREAPKESFANPMLPGNVVVHAFDDKAAGYGDSTAVHQSSEFFVRPGKQVGPYRVLELIGEGGMGAVFVAEQTKPMKRRVALKIIKPGVDTKEALARFEAERQALSMMDHPNIAKVLDAGSTEAGRPFFVMELVKGVAITEYCDQRKCDTQQRLSLFVSVCQAVAHAHQKGIIHRDIKPSNVLVADYDDEPVVKVIDFGVAKATTQKLGDKTVYTRFGQLVGTFEYMSPEQAKLNQLDIDTRSDVYSLGVLLYELITGSTPFDRQRLRSAALNEMVRIICEEDPPKPSTRLTAAATKHGVAANQPVAKQKLVKGVRGELDWVVMRSLEKDRKRRYQSASEFAQDVQRFLTGDVVEACPPTLAYRTKKLVLRNRVAASVACGLLLLLAIASVAGWVSYSAINDKYTTLENEARVQNAIRLVAQSETNRRIHPVKSMRQAVEAVEATYDHDATVLPIAHNALQNSIGELGGTLLLTDQGRIKSVSSSSDGRWIAIGADGTGVVLRDQHNLKSKPIRLPNSNALEAQFTPDMRWLVTAGVDGVMLWTFDGANTAKSVRLMEASEAHRFAQAIVISQDSRWAVVGFYGGFIHIWDLQADDVVDSERVISSSGVREKLLGNRLAINSNGTCLATTDESGEICLWDLTQPDLIPTRRFSNPSDCHLALSSGGRWLAVSSNGKAELWDLRNPDAPAQPLNGDENRDVRFSADGRYLAVGGNPCFVYDMAADDIIGSCIALDVDGSAPVFGPKKKWIANSKHNIVQLWNLSRLQSGPLPVLTLPNKTRYRICFFDDVQNPMSLYGHDAFVETWCFTSDGNHLVSTSWDGSVRLWRLEQANPASNASYRGYGSVQCSKVSPDGRWLVVGREGSGSRLWKMGDDGVLSNGFVLKNTPDGIGKVAFSPDGKWLVGTSAVPNYRDESGFARSESVAHVWDMTSSSPNEQAFALQHDGAVTSFAFDKSGRRLVTGCTDGGIRLWSMSGQQKDRLVWNKKVPTNEENVGKPLEGQAAKQMMVSITNDGSKAISASGQGDVLVWNLNNKQSQPKRLKGLKHCPLDAAISHDGRWAAAGAGYDEFAFVWDLNSKSHDVGIKIPGHVWDRGSFVTQVTFSPDGRWLATGSWDKLTNLFDLHRSDPFGEPARTIKNPSSVGSLSFSLDSQRLISGSGIMPTVIDLSRYPQQVEEIKLPVEDAQAVALTPDGKRAITGTRIEARIWDLDIESLLSSAIERLEMER